MTLINTKIYDLPIGDSHPVRMMGIINLSRESFYKGSVVLRNEEILARIDEMLTAGASIIDIGARSTAPGVTPISVTEERDRLLPVVKLVLKSFDCLVSIDTQYSSVASEAFKAGAHILNDISGFKTDPDILKVASDNTTPVIIMATTERPGDALDINDVLQTLRQSIRRAEGYVIDPGNIIIDPGIGRWIPEKTADYNVDLINQLERLRIFNKPILVGISRKSFIGDILDLPDPTDRLEGTLIATAIAIYQGAHVIRTHDVPASVEMIKLSKYFRDLREARST